MEFYSSQVAVNTVEFNLYIIHPQTACHPPCGSPSSWPISLDAVSSILPHSSPPLHPHPAAPRPPRLPPTHPSSMLSVGWALSLNSPLQWQAVSPSEKTPDLKRALRTLLSKMKVMSTAATAAPNTQLRAPCH